MARKSWNVAKITKLNLGNNVAEGQEQASAKMPSFRFWGSVRMTYTLCAFLSMVVQICMRNTLSFAILCMVKSMPEDTTSSNLTSIQPVRSHCFSGSSNISYNTASILSTHIEQKGDLEWTRAQALNLQGTFFYGYITTMPFAGHLSDKIGGKLLFVNAITLQAISFMLLPTFARLSYNWAVVVLVVQGLFAGCGNPALYQLFTVWAHPTERSALLSFAYGGFSVGALLASPLASVLCGFGWDIVFYVIGSVSLLFGISCHWLVYSTLEQHPRISPAERDYLKPPVQHVLPTNTSVPWKSILCSMPVYAFTFTHIFHTYGVMIVMLMLPRFLKEAMGFSLNEVGLLSSAPYLGSFVSKALTITSCSYIEKNPNVNLTNFRRLIYATCNGITCACIGVIVLVDCHHKLIVVIMTVAIGVTTDLAFSAVYWPSLLYFAPSYAGLLSGIANCLASCCGFLAPIGIALLVQTGLKSEWDLVMMSLILFYSLGAIVFAIFSSSKLQPWDLRQQAQQQPPKTITTANDCSQNANTSC